MYMHLVFGAQVCIPGTSQCKLIDAPHKCSNIFYKFLHTVEAIRAQAAAAAISMRGAARSSESNEYGGATWDDASQMWVSAQTYLS